MSAKAGGTSVKGLCCIARCPGCFAMTHQSSAIDANMLAKRSKHQQANCTNDGCKPEPAEHIVSVRICGLRLNCWGGVACSKCCYTHLRPYEP